MNTQLLIELFGYLGSALVVVSMLMASLVKLRVVNTVGSVISGTYALIIGSFPLALMNGCLIVINVYNLYKLLKTDKEYDIIRVSAGEASVKYFLERNAQDISRYFPAFDPTAAYDAAYMAFCKGEPAGLLLGQHRGNGTVELALDYSVPAYRDCSVAACFFSQLPKEGIGRVLTHIEHSPEHVSYMKKMGFGEKDGRFIKEL